MSNQKNILEDKVFTRFLVFSLLIGSFFLILTALEPNPAQSAYVNESDYNNHMPRLLLKSKNINNTSTITAQTEKVAKKLEIQRTSTRRSCIPIFQHFGYICVRGSVARLHGNFGKGHRTGRLG